MGRNLWKTGFTLSVSQIFNDNIWLRNLVTLVSYCQANMSAVVVAYQCFLWCILLKINSTFISKGLKIKVVHLPIMNLKSAPGRRPNWQKPFEENQTLKSSLWKSCAEDPR